MIRSAIVPLLAVLLALGSCAVQRRGPDQAVYCALGKSVDGYDIYCPKPVLNGGWPAPFAYDRPGISVEERISFPEDDFRPWPFVADVSFYLCIFIGLRRCWALRRGRLTERTEAPPAGEQRGLYGSRTD